MKVFLNEETGYLHTPEGLLYGHAENVTPKYIRELENRHYQKSVVVSEYDETTGAQVIKKAHAGDEGVMYFTHTSKGVAKTFHAPLRKVIPLGK